MAYDRTISIILGPAYAGLSDLKAQLVDNTGVNSGAELSVSVDIGGGNYLLALSGLADDFAGGIKIYQTAAPTVILAGGSLNPPDAASGGCSEETIHDALDSWDPDIGTPTPPIILPPDDADICRIFFWANSQGGGIPPNLNGAVAQITALPFSSSGRFFAGRLVDATYSTETGIAYWDIVRGSNVKITAPTHGINIEMQVPDLATYDLDTAS